MADQVPNPRHEYLTKLLQQVHQVQDQIQGKLKAPTEAMASGKVWVSPTATSFKSALIFEVNKYNRAVADLGVEVQEELLRTPKRCSVADAKAWRIEDFGG
ncbi:MAG: hypothetical protein ACRDOO_14460 [Actinomadura sp.]